MGVDTEDAYDTNVWRARELGLLVGQSSGAAYWAARRLAEELDEGVIVTVFCDGGDKYMTTAMWLPVVEAAVESAKLPSDKS
jgi:cysteine synthase B